MKVPLNTIYCTRSNRTMILFEESHVGVYNGLLYTLPITGSVVPAFGPSSGSNVTEIQGVYLYDGVKDAIKHTEFMTLDEIIERSVKGGYNVTGWIPRESHHYVPSSDSKGLVTQWNGSTVILRTLVNQKDPSKQIRLDIPSADIREEFLTIVFDYPNLLYPTLSAFEGCDGAPTMVIDSNNIHQLYQFLLMMNDPSILQHENNDV